MLANIITISHLRLWVLIASMLIHIFVVGGTVVMKNNGKLIKHKNVVKTIKSEDGDIVDCVDIYKQPAFDHPLLKNHKIQMKPSSYPNEIKAKASKIQHSELIQPKTILCPEGTIPSLRTRKSTNHPDTISSKTTTYGWCFFNVNETEEAMVSAVGDYTGLQAYVEVWNPKVEINAEDSGAYIWVQAISETDPDFNVAGVGWTVNPTVYGDTLTRLVTFWTIDNFNTTGCYDLRCAGFVQVCNMFYLGQPLAPVSRYDDPYNQYEIFISVYKDKDSGNWWLVFQGQHLGYWPSSIFTGMVDGADRVVWGGRITNKKKFGRHTFTEMGSGHLPWDGFTRSSYFRDLQYLDDSYLPKDVDTRDLIIGVTNTNIYALNLLGGVGANWGTHFYYGGVGSWHIC